jgi:DNA repair protein RadC
MRIKIVSCQMIKERTVNYQGENTVKRAIKSPDCVYRIATDVLQLDVASEEYFYIAMLNTKNGINGISEVSHGSLNASIVHPREVFKLAVLANASGIVCIHNHPSGDPEPSSEDIETTSRLVKAGELLGIKVHDHVIVGDGRYISLKERGLM